MVHVNRFLLSCTIFFMVQSGLCAADDQTPWVEVAASVEGMVSSSTPDQPVPHMRTGSKNFLNCYANNTGTNKAWLVFDVSAYKDRVCAAELILCSMRDDFSIPVLVSVLEDVPEWNDANPLTWNNQEKFKGSPDSAGFLGSRSFGLVLPKFSEGRGLYSEVGSGILLDAINNAKDGRMVFGFSIKGRKTGSFAGLTSDDAKYFKPYLRLKIGEKESSSKSVDLNVARPDDRPVVPYRGIIYTKERIAALRQALMDNGEYAAQFSKWFDLAGKWLGYDEEQLKKLLPPYDAVFAYGETDPETGGYWERFGEKACNLNKPYEVRSPITGKIYGIQKPGERFYDPGTGWVREDGQKFYFRGIWNSYVMEYVMNSVNALSMVYMLTGEEKVAERCLYLLDYMATMRSKRERPDGPVDWPYPLHKDQAFFMMAGNQANTRMINFAKALDLVGMSPAASAESSTNPGRTVFENIRGNLIEVMEPASLKALQNHGLSAYGVLIAKALLFGEPENVRLGIDAAYAFLDNCLYRDYEYYEVSASYSAVGASYGGRLIHLLQNYSPANFSSPELYPRREEFPYGMNFCDDPRWYALSITAKYNTTACGRTPPYGDAHADREVRFDLDRSEQTSLRDHIHYLYWNTTRVEWKKSLQSLYASLPESVRKQPSVNDSASLGASIYMPLPATSEKTTKGAGYIPESSVLLGGKSLCLLRSGKGENQRSLFIRGGHAESHAHDDALALILYGKGQCLTGEYGYRFFGTPDHLGFGTRPIAHKTVVVDEEKNKRRFNADDALDHSLRIYKPYPSADIIGYLPVPPVQFVEMSHPEQYGSDVKRYRRCAWLIDISDTDYYFLDEFRVVGGKTHDYAWVGPYPEKAEDGRYFSIAGVQPESNKGVWALAALSGKDMNAEYNRPGMSWGERHLGHSGRLKDQPAETVGKRWSPPPGNGYGYIFDVRSADTVDQWTAMWKLVDEKNWMQMTMLNPDKGGQKVVTAKSPALPYKKYHDVVVARRTSSEEGLASRFVNLTQITDADGNGAVKSVKWLDCDDAVKENQAVAVEVALQNGGRDIIVSTAADAGSVKTKELSLSGQKAFCRFDQTGSPVLLTMFNAEKMTVGGIEINAERSRYENTVTEVDAENNRIRVDGELPAGEVLAGSTCYVDSPTNVNVSYAHNEVFHISRVTERQGEGTWIYLDTSQGTVLVNMTVENVSASGQLTLKFPSMTSGYPEMRDLCGRQASIFKNGVKKGTAEIKSLVSRDVIDVDSNSSIGKADRLQVLSIKPGDKLVLPTWVMLKNCGNNRWSLKSNVSCKTVLPSGAVLE